MANLDTIALMNCLNCGQDKSFLRVLDTAFMLNAKRSHNSVVVCADCGAIMVRVGGMVGGFGWACHVPEQALVMEL